LASGLPPPDRSTGSRSLIGFVSSSWSVPYATFVAAAQLFVVKMGSTLPALRSRRGDFEDWIIDGAGLARGRVRVIDLPAGGLREAVSIGTPVLGICFGHQLLAHAHGGEVGDNPNGREFGTSDILLEEPARSDALLGDLPGRRAWGVQFHPEFDAEIAREYITAYRDFLAAEGQDPDALKEAARDDPVGPIILRRFAQLCGQGASARA
jgi:GMP synthase (glutamine-hydrolysing)